jgi:hypothetical protein
MKDLIMRTIPRDSPIQALFRRLTKAGHSARPFAKNTASQAEWRQLNGDLRRLELRAPNLQIQFLGEVAEEVRAVHRMEERSIQIGSSRAA